jgi:hypothetical protein
MAVFERAARDAGKPIPPLNRLDPVVDGVAVLEWTVADRTDQVGRRRFGRRGMARFARGVGHGRSPDARETSPATARCCAARVEP